MIDALRGWVGRLLLGAVGLGLIVYLVHGAGASRVAAVFWQAGAWAPMIFALELVQLVTDVIAIRALLGERATEVPLATWVRSSAVAYAMMILLPAGRAAGEVARATVVAKHAGAAAAATASTQLQASYLSAIALASAAAGCVVWWGVGPGNALAWMLWINALFMTCVSAGLLALLRDARLGRWLASLWKRFGHASDEASAWDPTMRKRIPWHAMIICATGRSAQVAQYGLILAAVGGKPSVRGAFVAHGVHLVGATLGDVIPNQLGIVDGTYRAFAGALGLANNPARALSIAFVAHATQLSLSAVCVVVAALTRSAPAGDERPSQGGAAVPSARTAK